MPKQRSIYPASDTLSVNFNRLYAYYDHESDYDDPNHALRKYESVLEETISLNALLTTYSTTVVQPASDDIKNSDFQAKAALLLDLRNETYAKTKEFLEINKAAQKYTLNQIANIRQQMRNLAK